MKRSRFSCVRWLAAWLLACALLASALPVLAEESPTVPLWYCLDESDTPPNPRDYLIPTSQSPRFSRCGFMLENGMLFLEFRESGSLYVYYGVDYRVWDDFSRAASLESYYDDHIKGRYDCSRVW